MSRLGLVAGLALAVLAGCGDTTLDTSAIRNFDRPVDMAFGCYGRLRILGDNGVADPEDEVVFTAQPVGSCAFRHSIPKTGTPPLNPNGTEPPGYDPRFPEGRSDNAPEGQSDDDTNVLSSSMRWLDIAVQPTSGTITLMSQVEAGKGATVDEGTFTVPDGDPLTPGHNAIAVGAMPIAIATDTSGCHALTANAGSCDLSVIDLTRLASSSSDPIVRSLPLTALDGAVRGPLLARPAAMVAADFASSIGLACPATPTGVVYVAYPECHAVAAIDAGTGEVTAAINFDDAGNPTIDPSGVLRCPRQCGDDRDALTAGARPSSLDIVRDERGGFQRLAIGLDNRPVIAVADLDTDGRFTVVDTVELEGDVAVTDVAISRQIKMGGDNTGGRGNNDDSDDEGVEAEFVYAAATDGTVRVAEVLVAHEECDTQVDPRYLYDERDPTRMVCFGVGQVGTPPRRAGVRSPGVRVSTQARPVAVTIVSADNPVASSSGAVTFPSATNLAGHFAFVTLSNGFTVVINVDDDDYPDTYLPETPFTSVLSNGLPHQLRDFGQQREQSAQTATSRACDAVAPIDPNLGILGGPRADKAPERVFATDQVNASKGYTLPFGHATLCEDADGKTPISDLLFTAEDSVRERAFPDWRMLPDENWFLTWEGQLSIDGTDLVVDGPSVRSGLVDIAGGGMRVIDQGRPFCAAGVEPFDLVTLRGCDPARGDAQCGTGETCYVHPDATVATGACLPTDRLEELSGACRDYLISLRRYSVFESFAGELRLHERWHELRTTPPSGCTSDAQCMQLATFEKTLLQSAHPSEAADVEQPYTYTCMADTSRAPGPNRCVMTCSDDSGCADGTVCRAGRCIEGIVPAPQCTRGLQRYDLRASDKFVVMGDRTGYLHPLIEDTASSRCVPDPTASPLLRGRFGLTAPPCSGGDPGDVAPNPCSESVTQAEAVPKYAPGTCTPDPDEPSIVRERITSAIRFSNPGFTFTMVDPTYPGDAMCNGDRGGSLGDAATVYNGFTLRFHVSAGFNALVAGGRAIQPSNIVRSPDGSVWVVDAGDIDDTVATTPNVFGQLLRIDPNSPSGSRLVFQ